MNPAQSLPRGNLTAQAQSSYSVAHPDAPSTGAADDSGGVSSGRNLRRRRVYSHAGWAIERAGLDGRQFLQELGLGKSLSVKFMFHAFQHKRGALSCVTNPMSGTTR